MACQALGAPRTPLLLLFLSISAIARKRCVLKLDSIAQGLYVDDKVYDGFTVFTLVQA